MKNRKVVVDIKGLAARANVLSIETADRLRKAGLECARYRHPHEKEDIWEEKTLEEIGEKRARKRR